MKKILLVISFIFISLAIVSAQESVVALSGSDTASVDTASVLRFDRGNFLHFGIGGGIGSWNYKLAHGVGSDYKAAFSANIDYTYYFLDWLGVGTGLHLSYYMSDGELNREMSLDSWHGLTDNDSKTPGVYDHRVGFDNWHEEQNLMLLEVPIALRFKVKPNKGGFFFNIGAKLALPIYASYTHYSGTLLHSGYYPAYDVVMSGLPGRFEDEVLANALEGSVKNRSWLNVEGFGEIGFIVQLDQTTDFTMGLYGSYLFNNLQKSGDLPDIGFRNVAYNTGFMEPYEGLFGTNEMSSVHPWQFGIKIGIATHILTKEERELLKAREEAAKQKKEDLQTRNIQEKMDTIFVRDTLYMYMYDTIVDNTHRTDTVYLIQTDTITGYNLNGVGSYGSGSGYGSGDSGYGSGEGGTRHNMSGYGSGDNGYGNGGYGDNGYGSGDNGYGNGGYGDGSVIDGAIVGGIIGGAIAGGSGDSGHGSGYGSGSGSGSGIVGGVIVGAGGDGSGSEHVNYNNIDEDWEDFSDEQYSWDELDEESRQQATALDGALTMSVIWFRFDDYRPILEPFDVIDTVARVLLRNPQLHVNVNGHACKIGTDSYNQRLALKRAKAVARALHKKGVPMSQMTINSLGASEPYRYNEGRHQYSKDRRVEIIPVGFYEPEVEDTEEDDYIVITHSNSDRVNYEQYTSFIGEDKLKRGEHIATLARKWYNDPYYWVFIYEANADKIADPNHVKAGLTLMIPDLTERLSGLSDTEADELAMKLKRLYVNGEAFDEQ